MYYAETTANIIIKVPKIIAFRPLSISMAYIIKKLRLHSPSYHYLLQEYKL